MYVKQLREIFLNIIFVNRQYSTCREWQSVFLLSGGCPSILRWSTCEKLDIYLNLKLSCPPTLLALSQDTYIYKKKNPWMIQYAKL